ncbi:hypothetical protein RND71_031085 [Anisodus tanguticus]|uniref:peptidylprolyl isomerase n=1 Tax=Anisodus tanguticus TaxID=243964 RepID=A0AAE1RB11_9SOLA|nr:hypothetical protein RND71_031085 [Anisodus tanguticus]
MWPSAEGGPPEMYYKHAPRTCRNFIELARRGYYDNVKFHRIIKQPLVATSVEH